MRVPEAVDVELDEVVAGAVVGVGSCCDIALRIVRAELNCAGSFKLTFSSICNI